MINVNVKHNVHEIKKKGVKQRPMGKVHNPSLTHSHDSTVYQRNILKDVL